MPRLLFLLLLVGCVTAAQAQRRPPPFPGMRDPFHRQVRIREVYKRVAYANAITAEGNFFLIHDCLGLSAGIAYERFLDKDGWLSVILPGSAFAGGTFTLAGARTGQAIADVNGVFAAPSLLFHPLGNSRHIDLAAGPMLMAGHINMKMHEAGSPGRLNPEKNFQRTDNLIAIGGTANMKLHTNTHFVFVTHLSVGYLLEAGIAKGAVVQFGVKLGARF